MDSTSLADLVDLLDGLLQLGAAALSLTTAVVVARADRRRDD
ncbi:MULTISPECIES: hypothetical protein [Micromonospora]|uniref:Uncharacterized protein n=1 Tax=Micromonospora rifamycinica TaxID=291594 RepID=A0A1C5GY42_9ACTN|nr:MULTISPECIES: hypothetical protein [Micromonospora]WFE66119.1 hypothetical protein O7625_23775 [Micromonospora sp. WMMD714]SCG38623.1 hypothetical protein GA0070623_0461 [Micromonospora rifamycinica]